MTTEATQDPQTPQPPVMNVAEVYRILGGLERGQAEIKDQLVRSEERNDQRFARIEERVDQRFTQQEERNDRQFREAARRVDRLWYTIVGIGAAIIVGYVLQQVFGA